MGGDLIWEKGYSKPGEGDLRQKNSIEQKGGWGGFQQRDVTQVRLISQEMLAERGCWPKEEISHLPINYVSTLSSPRSRRKLNFWQKQILAHLSAGEYCKISGGKLRGVGVSPIFPYNNKIYMAEQFRNLIKESQWNFRGARRYISLSDPIPNQSTNDS